jgi:hypothetical protein
MELDARAAFYYRVANAPVLAYPFPHFYLESVFPDDFYRELQAALPPLDAYLRIADTGTVSAEAYPERFSLDPRTLAAGAPPRPQAPFWQTLVEWLEDGRFARLLLDKFEAAIAARFGAGNEFSIDQDTRLIRDFTNFAIGPHTDSPRKLISLLFYLPHDDSMAHLGTSIFEPVDPEFECEGTKHYPFTNFRKVFTAPFRPNTLFAFCKTDAAFHGVPPIADANIERNMMLYNIYLNKVERMAAPPRAGFRWPWSRA